MPVTCSYCGVLCHPGPSIRTFTVLGRTLTGGCPKNWPSRGSKQHIGTGCGAWGVVDLIDTAATRDRHVAGRRIVPEEAFLLYNTRRSSLACFLSLLSSRLFWVAMRPLLFATAIAQLVIAVVDITTVPRETSANIVPGAYIVELTPGSSIKRGFASPHEELYHDLARRGVFWEVTREYSCDFMTGVALKLGSDSDLMKLAQSEGVQSIIPVYSHSLPDPIDPQILYGPYQPPSQPQDTQSSHVMTGVDKLHAQGTLGQGIKIGIIDSGIDYTHPALGGKFGPGNKVIGGYDFVGDAYRGSSGPPLDQCNGHGTHVAGIIAASPSNPFGISGVAHEASINSYRVFGCSGTVSDDVIIDALIRAYEDKNDIITFSLSSVGAWSTSNVGVVASRIADKGRVVVASAGNQGAIGAWYFGSPGTGKGVIGVGSIESVVVIRRGGCALADKITNARKFEAQYFLIYANQPLEQLDFGNATAALITQQDGIYLVQQAITANETISFSNMPWNYPVAGGGLVNAFSTYGPTNDMYLKPQLSAPGGRILSTYPVKLGSYKIDSGTSASTPFVAGASALLLQARGRSPEVAKSAISIFQNAATPVKLNKTSSLLETAAHQGAGLIQVYDAIKNVGSMTPSELLLNDTAYFKKSHKLTIKNNGKSIVTYDLTHVSAGTASTLKGIEVIAGTVSLSSNAASVSISPSRLTIIPGFTATTTVTFAPPAGLDSSSFPVYSGYIQAVGSDNTTLRSTYLGLAASLKDMRVVDNTTTVFGAGKKLPLIQDKNNQTVNGSATFTMQGTDFPFLIYRLVAGTPLLQVDLIKASTNVTSNLRKRGEDAAPCLNLEEPEKNQNIEPVSSPLSRRFIFDWLFPSKGHTYGGSFAQVPTLGVIHQDDYPARNSRATTASARGFNTLLIKSFANETEIPDGSYKVLFRALKITGNPKNEEDYEVWTSPQLDIKRI
ncbi:pyrolysin [Rhizoctonia solani AG-1 IA]|uniref:Pyrolysin n=1 Tax=Thanatephorus cucumeris (strain AG1-IA) TaxID=983506 RepID=L8WHY3_THACA|nr:pyrolysin [Rhizoctonia solani AG-1 IA]